MAQPVTFPRQERSTPLRTVVARVIGVAGVALYNWWILAALTGMVMSNRGLFSDLEAEGQPHAALLSHLDVASGLLMLVALLLRGSRSERGRRPEWVYLLAFSVVASIGGMFPYVCAEGVSATCRTAEWHLQLPARHYVHILAGIVEFATATAAVYVARRHRALSNDKAANAVRAVGWILVLAYPALGYVYLSDRFGEYVEPVFFVTFTALVVIELCERGPGTNSSFGREATSAPCGEP